MNWNKCVFFILVCSCITLSANAQQIITGIVKEEATGEPIENATIVLRKSNIHAHTGRDGSFSLQATQLPDSARVSCAGYKSVVFPVSSEETNLTINLIGLPIELSQVVVVSNQLLNQIMKVDLEMNPVNNSQDLLRKTPGLFIAQHAGGGKAEQIFLRGFDNDHGTDIRVTVDDLPVNMVSHAHGQGYSDLHFVIPETVENIDFGKGSYYADKGDFATSGYVNLKTFDKLDHSLVKVEGGMFNSVRTVGVINLLNDNTSTNRHNLYVAGEYNYTDGHFDKPQHFNRVNLFLKDNHWVNENTQLEWSASTFSSQWDASGQIPERAVNNGLISRWGAIDDTEGGNTNRSNISLKINRYLDDNANWQSLFYFTHYEFNLFSNFTLFSDIYPTSSEFGNEIQQKENRNIYGMEHKYTKRYLFADSDLLWKSGMGLRYDDIGNSELNHVYQRTTLLEPLSRGAIGEVNLNAYTSVEWKKGKWLVNPGVRLDYFIFNVEDKLEPATATQGETAFRVSPKLNFFYNANERYQLFLKTGMGFHSNDVRVVIAQRGEEILPYSVEADLGAGFKLLPGLLIQPSWWYLYLQQEFVYVGDEAVVEPSGETQRYGVDLSVRYQPLTWLYLDADVNYAHPRALGEAKDEDYIPLAPTFTSVGGVAVRLRSGLTAGLRYRYMKDRPANEDNSVIAKGYFVNDLNLAYQIHNWEFSVQAQNIFNVKWNEAQFDTETRLRNETESVSEICFTPGNPFFLKAGLKVNF
jgi:outer membrane cobalamin receptor